MHGLSQSLHTTHFESVLTFLMYLFVSECAGTTGSGTAGSGDNGPTLLLSFHLQDFSYNS